MQHPHLVERQTVQTVHDRILGDFQIPGFPLRFSSFPERLALEAPFLSEHNERILSSLLGYRRRSCCPPDARGRTPITATIVAERAFGSGNFI